VHENVLTRIASLLSQALREPGVHRIMKIVLALLLVGLFTGNCNSQGKTHDPDWIERLKTTPVARIEAGLPDKAFDPWLAEQTKGAQPKYQLGQCEAEGSASPIQCITVTAEVAPVRQLELVFAVPRDAIGKHGDVPVCTFVRGSIGPGDPRSKQPTRLIRRLSELGATL
jgi:hypothetical protein